MKLTTAVNAIVPDAVLNLISRPLPDRIKVYNGVAVRETPFFQENDYNPHKKTALWNATQTAIEHGDSVTFIGGGKGIVPIKTAQRGHDVTVIEGARDLALQLEQTAGLNAVDMQVIHGVVGDDSQVWGDSSIAKQIHPDELDADVVVLDCEGAETSILPLPQIETVVVESHPMFGVPETETRSLLDGRVVAQYRDSHGGQILVSK